MNQQPAPDRAYSRFRLGGTALLIVAVCAVGTLWAIQRAHVHREAAALQSLEDAGPRVQVVPAGASQGGGRLSIQGEAMPYVSTTLYPKVSGFLRQIVVDKGSVVRQGQFLAIVESVETNQDTAALKADYDYKKRAADRNRQLAKEGIISAQSLEDAESAAKIAREKLASQATLQGYQRIIAPFSGVVTQRFADPGALLQNGGSTATAQPILSLAQVDRLRVAIYLDQQVAARVKVGTPLEVRSVDRPDQVRKITISRLAGAVDPKTRTLLAEADLVNQDGAFLPGGAVLVNLALPALAQALTIPSEAIALRDGKTLVAIVGADARVTFRPVVLGDDTGTQVQVLQNLKPGERVILSPSVTLKDGDKVQPVEVQSGKPGAK